MHQLLAILSIVLAIVLLLVFRRRTRDDVPLRPVERMLHVVFVVSLVLMALSSILMLALGQAMHGWMLILHMSIAPLFALAIAMLAVLWADRSSDLVRLILLSAFVTILSAMFTMMTWFGSDWQRTLLDVHRISSMVLLVAAAAQAGRVLLAGSPHAARTGD